MLLNVPQALEADHDDLLDSLRAVLRTCKAAAATGRQLLDVLGTHCDLEAEAAGPLLAALEPLERSSPGALTATPSLVQGFRKAHPRLVQEHRTIAVLARDLEEAGLRLEHPEAVALARRLLTHVRLYDTVLFPAALLAGQSMGRIEPDRATG